MSGVQFALKEQVRFQIKIALIHFEIANLISQIKDFSQNKYFIDLTLSRGKKLKNSQFDCLL